MLLEQKPLIRACSLTNGQMRIVPGFLEPTRKLSSFSDERLVVKVHPRSLKIFNMPGMYDSWREIVHNSLTKQRVKIPTGLQKSLIGRDKQSLSCISGKVAHYHHQFKSEPVPIKPFICPHLKIAGQDKKCIGVFLGNFCVNHFRKMVQGHMGALKPFICPACRYLHQHAPSTMVRMETLAGFKFAGIAKSGHGG
jgi:hypothetical protein